RRTCESAVGGRRALATSCTAIGQQIGALDLGACMPVAREIRLRAIGRARLCCASAHGCAAFIARCALKTTARIVLLNGVGSAGKSAIAKALQTMTTRPFLHVQMDAFIDMMPEGSLGHPDWLVFETAEEGGKPSVVIRVGPVAERLFRGMRHAIAAMAAQGNNL